MQGLVWMKIIWVDCTSNNLRFTQLDQLYSMHRLSAIKFTKYRFLLRAKPLYHYGYLRARVGHDFGTCHDIQGYGMIVHILLLKTHIRRISVGAIGWRQSSIKIC